jgi:hypothetical protein
MKSIIISCLILYGFSTSAQQTRCYSYDAAGNRTTRVSCILAIQNPEGGNDIAPHALASISDDLGGTPSGIKDRLIDGDISQLVVYPNPSSGVFVIDAPYRKDVRISIYDSTGKSVWTRIGIPDQIDLMHWPTVHTIWSYRMHHN